MLHVVGKPLVLWSDLYNWAQFLVVKNNNDNNDRQSYLHVSDVLLYVPSFGASSSSASFKWTRILVFFWKFIGAARVDGRISKVKESARNSRAEPEGKKSLCGVKSFHLWYVIMPSYRLKQTRDLGKKLYTWCDEIITTKGRNNLGLVATGGGGKYIMVFEDNFLPVNCQRRAGGGSKEDRFVTGLANASMFSEKEFFSKSWLKTTHRRIYRSAP